MGRAEADPAGGSAQGGQGSEAPGSSQGGKEEDGEGGTELSWAPAFGKSLEEKVGMGPEIKGLEVGEGDWDLLTRHQVCFG